MGGSPVEVRECAGTLFCSQLHRVVGGVFIPHRLSVNLCRINLRVFDHTEYGANVGLCDSCIIKKPWLSRITNFHEMMAFA